MKSSEINQQYFMVNSSIKLFNTVPKFILFRNYDTKFLLCIGEIMIV